MKTPTKKIKKYRTVKKKGWTILNSKGEWTDQVSSFMSDSLIKFYQRCEKKGIIKIVSCTITYKIPLK